MRTLIKLRSLKLGHKAEQCNRERTSVEQDYSKRIKTVVGTATFIVVVLTATFAFSMWQNRNMPTGINTSTKYVLNYQIQPGDTLSSLAQQYHTNVQTLRLLNPTLTTNPNTIIQNTNMLIPIQIDTN